MKAEDVQSRHDLADFIQNMLTEHYEAPGAWENSTLPSFLDAMAAWINDMDGWYTNRGEVTPDRPTWETLAQILRAATAYE